MKKILKFNHTDFTPEYLLKIKGEKKIYAVFSTFGEREADLVVEKIAVLKTLPHGVIDRMIINHRRAGSSSDRTELSVSSVYSDVDIMISNDTAVPDMEKEKGKGADMRRTLYRLNMEYKNSAIPENIIVVFLDADVLPEYFGIHFITGLAGAVLNGADFVKGGFWRAMGRVKKYVAQPLFSVINHPSLSGLTEFSYPLSGECAGTLGFFNAMSFSQIYGVETSILIDAVMGNYTLADVNLGLYDHEHHNEINIQKMSFGIMRTYLKSLIDHGVISLNENASLSDIFSAEYIDSSGNRVAIKENLSEIRYRPLYEIL